MKCDFAPSKSSVQLAVCSEASCFMSVAVLQSMSRAEKAAEAVQQFVRRSFDIMMMVQLNSRTLCTNFVTSANFCRGYPLPAHGWVRDPILAGSGVRA